jgi:hypothetical protein
MNYIRESYLSLPTEPSLWIRIGILWLCWLGMGRMSILAGPRGGRERASSLAGPRNRDQLRTETIDFVLLCAQHRVLVYTVK